MCGTQAAGAPRGARKARQGSRVHRPGAHGPGGSPRGLRPVVSRPGPGFSNSPVPGVAPGRCLQTRKAPCLPELIGEGRAPCIWRPGPDQRMAPTPDLPRSFRNRRPNHASTPSSTATRRPRTRLDAGQGSCRAAPRTPPRRPPSAHRSRPRPAESARAPACAPGWRRDGRASSCRRSCGSSSSVRAPGAQTKKESRSSGLLMETRRAFRIDIRTACRRGTRLPVAASLTAPARVCQGARTTFFRDWFHPAPVASRAAIRQIARISRSPNGLPP